MLLVRAHVRQAVEYWLGEPPLSAADDAKPRELAASLVDRWRQVDDLIYQIDTAPQLHKKLVTLGLSASAAGDTSERLLHHLFPLHRDAVSQALEPRTFRAEVHESNRLARGMEFRPAQHELEALRAVVVPSGRGMASEQRLANEFFVALAALNEAEYPDWDHERWRSEYLRQTEQYRNNVRFLEARNEPVPPEVRAPFYLVVDNDGTFDPDVLAALRNTLGGAAYSATDTPASDLERAFGNACRELRRRSNPQPSSSQGSQTSVDSRHRRAETSLGSAADVRTEAVATARVSADELQGPFQARTCTWLHISDLHFKAQSAHRDSVLEALADDAQQLVGRWGGLDFVFVTGDIAFSGKPEDFTRATTFLRDRLCASLQLDPKRVFVVPGNHDVDRDRTRSDFEDGSAHDAHMVMRADPVRALENLDRRRLARIWGKFDAYCAFASLWSGCDIDAARPYFVSQVDTGLGPVVIGGLNTALLSMDDKDGPRTLAVGQKQINEVAASVSSTALLMTLQHHPPGWLADGNVLETRLSQRAHLGFCGHVHEPDHVMTARAGVETQWFTAGAAHDAHQIDYGYAMGSLGLDGLRHWPRAWSVKQQRFVPDTQSFHLEGDVEHRPVEKLPGKLAHWIRGRAGA